MTSSPSLDPTVAAKAVQDAAGRGDLTTTAAKNLTDWLTQDRYAGYLPKVTGYIQRGDWKTLDDVYWTVIPFGTGGRRGRMFEIGSNAINDRTIGESAQGLADYVVEYHGGVKGLSCAIAYDTRHRSRHFAELCASIMVAAGMKVYFVDDYRATPQLSVAVRHYGCDCGIMVTASHNPPSDNAVKVYWSTGGQVLAPHDRGIIDRVMNCQTIHTVPFDEALADGRVQIVTEEVDRVYLDAAAAHGTPGPRNLKVLYTPLHGVGEAIVAPLLARDGFDDVTIYEPHRERSGDFPNVPGHVSNPERTEVFEAPIAQAQKHGHELIMATDPDCDRLGAATPVTMDPTGPWKTFNGNQIAALLCDYVLSTARRTGRITGDSYVVKTLVTTELVRRIAASYNVRTVGDLLVGYKYIAEVIDREGPADFLYGCEESHGYLVGDYARDKDGGVACMLFAELAASVKAGGQSLHDHLGSLYQKHGLHREHLINVMMEGSEGMAAMRTLMQRFRDAPPATLGDLQVSGVRDYAAGTRLDTATGQKHQLIGPTGDLVILDLGQEGNYIAVRPSGTEPKVKFYLFTSLTPEQSADLDTANAQLDERLAQIEADVRQYAL